MEHKQPDWWKTAVIYQIYPRSFQDSNGDGIRDLQGITMRLDYLTWLGVDAIWIGPFYPSPMVDFGYDITDYCNVDPRFGDLETFARLVEQAHRRHLKVLIDCVPNWLSKRSSIFVILRSIGREKHQRVIPETRLRASLKCSLSRSTKSGI